MIPALDRLDTAERILIAGCGGGFDVYGGVPLAARLLGSGKTLVLANFSFTALAASGGEQVIPSVWRVDRQSVELPYFPERWLAEWFSQRGQTIPTYGFEKASPSALADGYRQIMVEHGIEQVLLIDGGTDSVIFGDEPGLGTVVEDAVSIVAAQMAAGDAAMLASIGFGVDHFHGVSHHSFLENAATLIRDGAYLGTASVTPGSEEADAFIDAVEYANQKQSRDKSIVLNSILSALRGEFGDYHATDRTMESELFINPLMAQYWFFHIPALVARMSYAEELAQATSWSEARLAIARVSGAATRRPRTRIPL